MYEGKRPRESEFHRRHHMDISKEKRRNKDICKPRRTLSESSEDEEPELMEEEDDDDGDEHSCKAGWCITVIY